MSFRFGVDDDDLEENAGEVEDKVPKPETRQPSETAAPAHHDLSSLLRTLPSRISYSTFRLPGLDGIPLYIPRRELFDIRAQLMTEDTSEQPCTVGITTDDITPNVYEGGFKTWECAIDLANYVHRMVCAEDNSHTGQHHIVEVGAGTALPTLVLFQHFLRDSGPVWSAVHLSLADYNQAVLETTTVPNLLLTWYLARSVPSPPQEGDLEITENLLYLFQKDLSDRAIHISGISGAWSDAFGKLLVPFDGLRPQSALQTLFLASETIYSPQSIRSFTELLMRTLKGAEEVGGQATALIAAKSIYFGVGGGVVDFLKVLIDLGGEATVAWESMGSGVGRVILEVVTHDRIGAGSL